MAHAISSLGHANGLPDPLYRDRIAAGKGHTCHRLSPRHSCLGRGEQVLEHVCYIFSRVLRPPNFSTVGMDRGTLENDFVRCTFVVVTSFLRLQTAPTRCQLWLAADIWNGLEIQFRANYENLPGTTCATLWSNCVYTSSSPDCGRGNGCC